MRILLLLSAALLIQSCKSVKEPFDADSIQVIKANNGVNAYLCDNSLSFNSYDCSVDANNNKINNIIKVLTKYPNSKVTVHGFCDDVGSEAINKTLSFKRAKTVKNYLVSKGIDPKRIKIKAYGEDSPFVPNNSNENRAKNRKVICSVALSKKDVLLAKQ